MRNIAVLLLFGVAQWAVVSALGGEPSQPVWRVLPAGELPADARLGTPRNLRDAYHPWTPPGNKADWEQQADAIRQRVLVSNGLWPLPPRTPLNPVIHGKIDRGDYTVEKVFFTSHPGHYVCGNLYRPKNHEGKLAGVLSPHGHWSNGRFYDAVKSGGGDRAPQKQLDTGAEKHASAAQFPLQARLVQLARLGCVVFHYDMVGNADSRQIAHRAGFTDVEAGLRLQNFMGLQTWNSIRSLDFLLSLPDVDANRIGVTGASGGGTQTFVLCAVDPRPTAAFPAVMVSTAMQGGCICENAEYLRIGLNNIALAALFAPKPLAMSGADDWTVNIETKGLPELRQVYSFYGKRDFVLAKAFPQFKHNYNQVARELMYSWFNAHLKLGHKGPIFEADFKPIPPEELSVYDAGHPLPGDAKTADQLRDYFTEVNRKQYHDLLPKSKDGLAEYRRVVGTAARVMLDPGDPAEASVHEQTESPLDKKFILHKGLLGRSKSEQIPFVIIEPAGGAERTVLWIDSAGKSHLFDDKGRPTADILRLLAVGVAVASADVFLTGEFVAAGAQPVMPAVDSRYQGYTFGYNRPVLSNRVRDVLALIAVVRKQAKTKTIDLVGTGEAGKWVLLARATARDDRLGETIVDLRGRGFENVHGTADPLFLPGALKYGGIGGLGGLTAPGELTVAGLRGIATKEKRPLERLYRVAGGELTREDEGLSPQEVVTKLLR